ncbi:vitamin B12 dependent methionine synthase [candidate division KSB1 bacterium]|nr:vitamin B12 dependent methionine synthase [candidate division KSB1 bacterium]
MEVLLDIPYVLDAAELSKTVHIDPASDWGAELRELIDLAEKTGKPKAAYAEAFVERRNGDTVEIGGISFTSRTLSKNLAHSERVFPFLITCGHEMDQAFSAPDDMLKAYWWDEIKAALLTAAITRFEDHLQQTYRLGKTASMSPGSGDADVWPIEQQKGLFALLGDVEQTVGVRLTESFLMVPNKTISGILFSSEIDFRTCEVCHRATCPSRQAVFNPRLWKEMHQI